MSDNFEYYMTSIVRELPYQLAKVAYDYGFNRAIHKDHWSNPKQCDFKDLNYEWDFWYGATRLCFNTKLHQDDGVCSRLCEIKLLSATELLVVSRDDRVRNFVVPIEVAIGKMLLGIQRNNSIRQCECAFHNLASYAYSFYEPPLELCVEMGGKWVCKKCQTFIEDKCRIPASILSPNDKSTAYQNERAKLNSALRFQVLERDGFRCKACGANPRDDKQVVLHVDHITPIAKGGKTVLDNLQCLCSKCNLAKSDKIIHQMALWENA